MTQVRTDELTWREVDDEIVVLDLRTSRYLSLNGAGALLWKRLADGGADRETLVSVLTTEFSELDPADAARDVDAFVEQCTTLNLLV